MTTMTIKGILTAGMCTQCEMTMYTNSHPMKNKKIAGKAILICQKEPENVKSHGFRGGQQKKYGMKNQSLGTIVPTKKEYVRLDKETYNAVQKSDICGDFDGKKGPHSASASDTGFLRPKESPILEVDIGMEQDPVCGSEGQSYRVLHVRKLEEFWNKTFREHQLQSPSCKGYLKLDMSKEVQWGVGWKEAVHCASCTCKSKLFKLYEEIPTFNRGQKIATYNDYINRQLAQQQSDAYSSVLTFHHQVTADLNIIQIF
ncbi:hypothetical protein KUTeg_001286 [Tegillarca granosa]|uniref:Mutator-like transposase domain-containing protein n=1 Tax=Tegillarca granosa TaxID=220873 RepID=A0ABQ9FYG3_TEGGR|nr:hypothetical protein KUTeg_001286 [Tegillarca granosa]